MTESFAERLGIPEHEFRLVVGSSRIEYDADKDDENRRKHGYALESAVHLLEACFAFFTRRRIMTSDAFVENGEARHMHLAEDENGTIFMVVTTMRPGEVVRVISLRPASDKERSLFDTLMKAPRAD